MGIDYAAIDTMPLMMIVAGCLVVGCALARMAFLLLLAAWCCRGWSTTPLFALFGVVVQAGATACVVVVGGGVTDLFNRTAFWLIVGTATFVSGFAWLTVRITDGPAPDPDRPRAYTYKYQRHPFDGPQYFTIEATDRETADRVTCMSVFYPCYPPDTR